MPSLTFASPPRGPVAPTVGATARRPSRNASRCPLGNQRPSTTSIPESTKWSFARGSFPTRAVRRVLSRVTIWETLATESLGRPVSRGERRTFPGASAQRTLLVSGTHTTVAILLRFRASPCTTTTGRRKPGPEPAGSGRSAHQISPWEITNRCAPRCGGTLWRRTNLLVGRVWRRPDPWPRSPGLVRAGPRTRRGHACRADCATSPCGAQAAPPPRTRRRGLRPLFSYSEYNYRLCLRQVRPLRGRRREMGTCLTNYTCSVAPGRGLVSVAGAPLPGTGATPAGSTPRARTDRCPSLLPMYLAFGVLF